jgi:RNA polymerase sigma-70 factor (ECF subfamily)
MSDTEQQITLFQHYRPLMLAIAYRMLGSAAEAEDIVQDTYLRFQAAPLAEVSSPKAYLTTIVTRLCLNQLTSARVQRETYLGPWLPEPILNADYAELADPETIATADDSISIAFLTLLEKLTPAERAVFLLHEVFDYEYAEIARILDKSETACRKLFSRAKGYLVQHRPRFKANPEEHQRLLEHFLQAVGAGDLDGLTTLLADEVIFWADGGGKVRGAALEPVHGRLAVARFVLNAAAHFAPVAARYRVAEINGKPTLLICHADGAPAIVISVDIGAGRIQTIWAMANPDKLSRL